jgi:DNA-binding XRE family transcriptional regulator
MTKEKFIERLDDLEMTQKEFALIIGYSYQSVKQWKDGTIPKWVHIVLEYLETIQQNTSLSKKYNFCSKTNGNKKSIQKYSKRSSGKKTLNTSDSQINKINSD